MLRVRIADESDSKDIFEWRNNETTIQMSHSTQLVDWQGHCRWFGSVLTDANKFLFICLTLDGTNKIAAVRFDVSNDVATISINLSPSMRGRGLAKDCLIDSIACLKSIHDRVCCIEAEIKSMNVASQKAFEGAGFTLRSELDNILHYEFAIAEI